jgi:hypothetical protein
MVETWLDRVHGDHSHLGNLWIHMVETVATLVGNHFMTPSCRTLAQA